MYDALQVQFNRRVGRNFRFGGNYTWSKTIVYSRQQWVSDYLNKNIAGGTRVRRLRECQLLLQRA